MTTQVIVWGLGKLGRLAVEACAREPRLAPVAVVTRRPAQAGPLPPGIAVFDDLAGAAERFPDAVVVHTNHAVADELAHALENCANLGLDVVTSSGLFHPATQLTDGGKALDSAARSRGTRIATAGLQPGFVFDVLPALLLQMAPGWRRLTIVKPSDARSWPRENRHMQGIGESPADLERETPYPLGASAHLIGEAVGRRVEHLHEARRALTSEHDVRLDDETIPAGLACGFRHECVAELEGGRQVTLVWEPTVAHAENLDLALRIVVDGDSWLRATVDGAFTADPYPGTVARMLSVASAARRLAPGLHRVIDVGLAWD
ncbi:hypothetical protein ABZ490_36320 [Streptomyces sp. NPDC005811]|uniref:hypothetical protein n=1 Tax=Streptomyces sp. NPDC005811 TaxID=3154565 RepID=UPI0033FF5A04